MVLIDVVQYLIPAEAGNVTNRSNNSIFSMALDGDHYKRYVIILLVWITDGKFTVHFRR